MGNGGVGRWGWAGGGEGGGNMTTRRIVTVSWPFHRQLSNDLYCASRRALPQANGSAAAEDVTSPKKGGLLQGVKSIVKRQVSIDRQTTIMHYCWAFVLDPPPGTPRYHHALPAEPLHKA